MTDIVEQLRMLQSGAAWVCGETAVTLEDAADEIERLRAERDGALRLAKRHMDEKHRTERQAAEDWDVLQQRIKTAEAERDRLREALQDMLADREAWQIGRDTRDRARAALKETGHE
jgi:chromosome segregation ATPase